MIPPMIQNIEYTIGATAVKRPVGMWSTTPLYCADMISMLPQDVHVGQEGPAVTFDGSFVSVYYDGGLDLSGSSSKTIPVSIEATLGG
jgi:hypothetical protein